MFIYRFNRLIRNRFLWIVFAVVVAFAFLSVDSCVRNPGGDVSRAAGRLGGKAVDATDFSLAELFVAGGRARRAQMPPSMVETQAWRHLAALHTARGMGLGSTDDEIRQAIREVPAFSRGGRFDPRLYRQAVERSLGVTPAIYERLMADQIAIAKLSTALDAANLVAPMEMEAELADWTDRITILYAVVSNRFEDAEMALDENDLRAFHAEHAGAFARPDRVGVHYAAVSVSNYLGAVSVPPEDIEEYYDSHADRYTRAGSNTVEAIPLAEVRDDIAAELALEEAAFAAVTNAAAFVEQLSLADLEEFSWRARARGMTIGTAALFSAEQHLPQIEREAESEFREAAFDLDPERADARHAVVKGRRQVYILRAWTNSPAYTPPFEEVAEEVRPPALADARARAFGRQADEIRAALLASMAAGTNFADAAAALALNVSTSLTFAVHAVMRADDLPHARALVPAAMRLRPGELSTPVAVPGGALLVYCVERRPGDPLAAEMIRPQVREALARRRGGILFQDWLAWNLGRTGFSSARSPSSSAAAKGDDEEEEEK